MADPSLAATVAEVAGHLRFQKVLGVRELSLGAEARQALVGLEKLPQKVSPSPAPDQGRPDLGSLARAAAGCRRCRLAESRTKVVFGEGDPKARLVFIGEGPGKEEDESGRPFVGPAGRLLTRIIQAMGLGREEVYITNVVKCRPPGNRNPKEDEIEACRTWLEPQLTALEPEIIVALGKVAAQNLLRTATPISALRGVMADLGGVPLMPTFHPAYLLRQANPAGPKRLVWEDMKQVMTRLGLEAPSR